MRKRAPFTDSVPARMLCLRITWELGRGSSRNKKGIACRLENKTSEKKSKELRSFNSGEEKAVEIV